MAQCQVCECRGAAREPEIELCCAETSSEMDVPCLRGQPHHRKSTGMLLPLWLVDLDDVFGKHNLASIITLERGDVISTGTPASVGYGRKPQL